MKEENQEIPSTVAGADDRGSTGLILEQLNRILGHPEFHATDNMKSFLRFVVTETLAGRSQNIKGFTIATEVYGRDADFDAAHDPVVRIQAGRLRRAMERYYLVAGRQDPIRIEIPKGTYVPIFTEGSAPESFSNRRAGLPTAQRLNGSWPSVLVMPFSDMTGNPELAYVGAGLATELCIELGHCEHLRVMLHRGHSNEVQARKDRTDFIVGGSVRSDGANIKVVVQLIDGETREQLWADSLKSPLESGNLIAFQEKAANTVAAHIAGEHGVIMRRMTLHSGGTLTDLTTYQAILKGYAYHHAITPVSFMQAFQAVQPACARDPECGLVCTMLALLYLDNIAFEFFDLDRTPLGEALHLAREGALILPDSQFSRLVLARAHMLENKLDLALNEVEAALALRPESLLFMDAIGYLLLLLGDWERGEQLVSEAIQLNPFHAVYAHYGLWLNAIRRQDLEHALEQCESTAEVGDFWGPLARAATLGLLDRSAEGQEAVDQLLTLKPNFQERGRLLIGHYIKFPDILERVIQGLAVAGLDID